MTPLLMRTLKASLIAAAVGLTACTGLFGDPPGGNSSSNTTAASQDALHSQFPRHSHRQWENTVRDLLYLDAIPGLSNSFTSDPLGGKTFDNNEVKLQVTPGLWADYQRAAEELAAMVTSDPAKLDKILPANLPADPAAKAKAFIEGFGRRAFRRPLTAAEVGNYEALFSKGTAILQGSDAFVDGVNLVLQAMLQSPFFVYRAELSDKADQNGRIPLNGYEIATKLSYMLWNTMPDDKLLDAAAAGELNTKDGVRAYAAQMLNTPEGKATVASFHEQLYDYGHYYDLNKNATKYPDWSPDIGADLQRETEMFVEHIIFGQGHKGTLADLLTSHTTFVNDRLAAIYGLNGSFSADFTQAELPADQMRSGLLTRLGFLASHGTASDPDSILRGVFINRRIICAKLPDPPNNVPPVPPGPNQTNRERIETHTGAGTCGASCHGVMINPAGFAFEHFGAIGEYRTEDNGFGINAADSYPFDSGAKSYANAVEFSQILADGPEAHRCYAKFWAEYALGRDMGAGDDKMIDALGEASHTGTAIQDLILQIVETDAFLTRSPVEAP